MENSRSQSNLDFLKFMNLVYYGAIGLVFLGMFISIANLPDDTGGIKLLIVLFGLIQMSVLFNLITLNSNVLNNYGPSDSESKPLLENGSYEEFFDNGKLKIKGMMKDGVKEGVWEYFYYDGTIQNTKKFENGKEI
jgi:hypothetical protein